jgi:hypothetical protein
MASTVSGAGYTFHARELAEARIESRDHFGLKLLGTFGVIGAGRGDQRDDPHSFVDRESVQPVEDSAVAHSSYVQGEHGGLSRALLEHTIGAIEHLLSKRRDVRVVHDATLRLDPIPTQNVR